MVLELVILGKPEGIKTLTILEIMEKSCYYMLFLQLETWYDRIHAIPTCYAKSLWDIHDAHKAQGAYAQNARGAYAQNVEYIDITVGLFSQTVEKVG